MQGRVLIRDKLLPQAVCGFIGYHSFPSCIFNILKEAAYWASHVYLAWDLKGRPRVSYFHWLPLDSCSCVLAQPWVSFSVEDVWSYVTCCYSQLCTPKQSTFSFYISHRNANAYFPIEILVSFCGQEMDLTTLSELNLGFSSIFFLPTKDAIVYWRHV